MIQNNDIKLQEGIDYKLLDDARRYYSVQGGRGLIAELTDAAREKDAEIEALKERLESAKTDLESAEKEAEKLLEQVDKLKARLRKEGKGGFRFPWW